MDSDGSDIGTSYEHMHINTNNTDHHPPTASPPTPPPADRTHTRTHTRTPSSSPKLTKPPPTHISHRDREPRTSNGHAHRRTSSGRSGHLPLANPAPAPDPEAPVDPSVGDATTSGLPNRYTRNPPTTPILLPEYRYCSRDEIVRPFRAHHCRACGTVCALTMQYDHPISYCF